jgi:hypothetical protein
MYIRYTVRSESHRALRLRYVDLVVSIKVAVEVCCCFVTFHCIRLLLLGSYSIRFLSVGAAKSAVYRFF